MRYLALSVLLFLATEVAFAQQVQLAASNFATYVSDEGKAARLQAIVEHAFTRMDRPVQLSVMSQAFLGSALLSGNADGEFAFIDLGSRSPQYLFSKPYLPVYLHAVSKTPEVEAVRLPSHLHNARVAVENRFANTPKFRLLKEIKWSRNPSSYDAFKQLADDRAPYLITTRLLIDEFNYLLKSESEELLHSSKVPLMQTSVHISLNKSRAQSANIIAEFDSVIDAMQRDGTYNTLLGVTWLTKDINADGVADYITSENVQYQQAEKSQLNTAYPLDTTPTGNQSVFVLDGKIFNSWQSLSSELKPIETKRSALLDPDVYSQMMKRW